MALIDFFTRKKQIDTGNNLYGLPGMSPGWLRSWQDREKILKILDNCGATEYEARNPRDYIRLSRTLETVFPFAKRALSDFSSLVGNVRVDAVEEGAVPENVIEEINELIQGLPILSEWDWMTPRSFGVNTLTERLAKTMLRDGMTFCETRYLDGNIKNYQGVLVFDSDNFDYVRETPGPYRLKYRGLQFPDESPLYDLTFSQIGYDYRNAYPWASGLFYGTGFYAHLMITLLVAIKNINLRKGAPVEFSIISVKDDSKLQDTKTKEAYIAAIDSIQKTISDATQLQLEGRAFSGVAKMPMDIQLLSKAFGVDALQEVNPETLNFILMGFCNALEIPMEFLGVVLGSSGFSPERFKVLYKIWGTKIDNVRNRLTPTLQREIRQYLFSKKVNPAVVDRLKVMFENPDFRDESEKTATDKTQAETNKIHTEVAQFLSQLDTEEAIKYLVRVGLVEESFNPQPSQNGMETE